MPSSPQRRLLLLAAVLALIASVAIVVLVPRESPWQFVMMEPGVVDRGVGVDRWDISRNGRSFDAVCMLFSPKAFDAAIVDLPAGLSPSLEQLRRENGAQVAFNGGYFDPDFRPLGLLRINGHELSPLASKAPLSAALLIDADGTLSIADSSDPAVARAPSAIQCGPFIVDPGGERGIHTADGLAGGGPAAGRTVLATDGTRVCLIVTGPVSLPDLCDALLSEPKLFGLETIDRAVNLDGGPSSGVAIDLTSRKLIQEPRGKIRNAVLLTPKASLGRKE